jgi:AraC family L-rhamnose operon regulatory protein RhaS
MTGKSPPVLQYPSAKDIEHYVKTAYPPPIYQSGPNRLEIDSCKPQRKALSEGKIELHALSKGHYPGKRMNSNVLPGLVNIGYWNCRGSQDWGLDFHRNEGMEIVFMETGSTAFEVDGQTHPLHAGNLAITRPWQLHRLGDPHIGRGRLFWLIFDVEVRRPNQDWKWPSWLVLAPQDLVELTRKLRLGEQSVWMTTPPIRAIFKEIGDCVLAWPQPRAASRLAVAVNRLMVELLNILTESQSTESPQLAGRRRTVEFFLNDLARNPASSAEPWTLQSMANYCGMGITAMTKYCRELVNNGPMAYLNQCRLEHAARALSHDPGLSVTEIALRAGFNSSQYFATLFRKRYRMTPICYRSINQHSRDESAGGRANL